MTEIGRLVKLEGNDAAAEERIILILALRDIGRRDPLLDYINTDLWRARILKAQGRKRERRV